MDARSKGRTCHTTLNLVGCMLFIFSGGIPAFWGSVSVYVLSYVLCTQTADSKLVEAPIMLGFHNSLWTIGFLASAVVNKYVTKDHKRWLLLTVGMLVTDVLVFACYFAIQISYMTLNIVFGMLAAFGFGLNFGSAFNIVLRLTERHIGLFSTMFLSSASVGALFIIQGITWYANPDNLTPDWVMGSSIYFRQESIINRVPALFLIYGVFTVTTQMIGLALIYYKQLIHFVTKCTLTVTKETSKQMPMSGDGSNAKPLNSPEPETNSIKQGLRGDTGSEESPLISQKNEYTPKQMLMSPTFYVLCFALIVAHNGITVSMNYFKLFGQIWIQGDHLLSAIGSVAVITSTLMRVFVGLALDKFGPAKCSIFLTSLTAIIASFFYFTPMINRWLYFCMGVIFTSMELSLYACFLAATPLILGKTSGILNLGLTLIPAAVFDSICPFIIGPLLANLGWFTMFLSVAFLHLVVLLLCAIVVF